MTAYQQLGSRIGCAWGSRGLQHTEQYQNKIHPRRQERLQDQVARLRSRFAQQGGDESTFGNSTKYDEAVIRVSARHAGIGDRDVGIVGAPDG